MVATVQEVKLICQVHKAFKKAEASIFDMYCNKMKNLKPQYKQIGTKMTEIAQRLVNENTIQKECDKYVRMLEGISTKGTAVMNWHISREMSRKEKQLRKQLKSGSTTKMKTKSKTKKKGGK